MRNYEVPRIAKAHPFIFAIAYSAVLALVYTLLKQWGQYGGIDLLAGASFLAFLVSFLINPKKGTSAIFRSVNVIRGVAFAVGNYLLLFSQSQSSTFVALSGAAAGLLIGQILARVVLGEKGIKMSAINSTLVLIGAVIFLFTTKSYLSIVAGAIGAIGGVSSRAAVMKKGDYIENTAGMLFYGFIILAALLIPHGLSISPTLNLIPLTVLLLLVQFGYLIVLSTMEYRTGSIVLFARLPIIFFIEVVFFQESYSNSHLVGSATISFGLLFILFDKAKNFSTRLPDSS